MTFATQGRPTIDLELWRDVVTRSRVSIVLPPQLRPIKESVRKFQLHPASFNNRPITKNGHGRKRVQKSMLIPTFLLSDVFVEI